MTAQPYSPKEWRQPQRAAFFSLVQHMAVDPGRQTPEWSQKEASFLASLSQSTNVNEFLPATPSKSASPSRQNSRVLGSRLRATPGTSASPPTPPSSLPAQSSLTDPNSAPLASPASVFPFP